MHNGPGAGIAPRSVQCLAVCVAIDWLTLEEAGTGMSAGSDTFPNLRITHHPLIQHKVSHLRDELTDSKVFRELVRELTGLLLYEATTDLPVAPYKLRTPMEQTTGYRVGPDIAFVPILRAGVGMVDAAIDAIPSATVYHLGMYRDETTHKPVSYYNKLPVTCTADLIFVLDPMLATGGSAADAIAALKQWGATRIRFISIISSPEGVSRLLTEHPDVPVYTAALDRELNENKFILPGLGDAGDRLYGTIPH
jgi:uracil phosphoribosyltransferase